MIVTVSGLVDRDVFDPNPAVRSTAVTTICSLRCLLPHAETAIAAGLRDSNPGVRVSAVTGAGKVSPNTFPLSSEHNDWLQVCRHSPAEAAELGLADKLYEMLRDPEPTVVTFSLQTLNIVLAAEGGVRVNRKMVRYFLTRLAGYREKEFCFLMDWSSLCEHDPWAVFYLSWS